MSMDHAAAAVSVRARKLARHSLSIPHILQSVIDSADTSHLPQIALVNQQWFAAACPHLYSHAELGEVRGDSLYVAWQLRNAAPLRIFRPTTDTERFHLLALKALRTVTIILHFCPSCLVYGPYLIKPPIAVRCLRINTFPPTLCDYPRVFDASTIVLRDVPPWSAKDCGDLFSLVTRTTRKLVMTIIPPAHPGSSTLENTASVPDAIREVVVYFDGWDDTVRWRGSFCHHHRGRPPRSLLDVFIIRLALLIVGDRKGKNECQWTIVNAQSIIEAWFRRSVDTEDGTDEQQDDFEGLLKRQVERMSPRAPSGRAAEPEVDTDTKPDKAGDGVRFVRKEEYMARSESWDEFTAK